MLCLLGINGCGIRCENNIMVFFLILFWKQYRWIVSKTWYLEFQNTSKEKIKMTKVLIITEADWDIGERVHLVLPPTFNSFHSTGWPEKKNKQCLVIQPFYAKRNNLTWLRYSQTYPLKAFLLRVLTGFPGTCRRKMATREKDTVREELRVLECKTLPCI